MQVPPSTQVLGRPLLALSPNGDYLGHMETNDGDITAATNRKILLGIVDADSSRNAVARKAGIPLTTFNRKLDGHGDFTLRELGQIAQALNRQLADILPSELTRRRAA